MKNTVKFGALLLTAALLFGCTNAFHNGTEMAINKVEVTGLPANPYSDGQVMVFSYNKGSEWVHDNATDFASSRYRATVSGGALTYNFSPPIVITTPQITFLLIDPSKTWNSFQVDKKHSGKKGGDAILDNTWTGESTPLTLTGTVSGDDVTWTLQ